MENSTSNILQHVSTVLPSATHNATPISTMNFTHGVEQFIFSWYDYVIFSFLLSVSLFVGIYFGCCGKKQNAREYLLAGGKLKVLPVVISSVASHTSGLTLLALPAEVYSFGANYWLSAISLWIVTFITIYIYLPVFYKLQLTSTYEYLGLRFDKKTRKLASVMFTISVFSLVPIVTYIPSMAFSTATGMNIRVVTPIICGICIFYTSIGGLKALVWSDSLQFSLTMGALLAILGLGLNKVNGLSEALKIAADSGRLNLLDFQFDLTKRDCFWTMVIGFTIHWLSATAVNQGCVQKFLAVGTLRESKMVVFFYCAVGMVIVKTISVLTGLVMYAKYSTCDPLSTGQVRHGNEMLPHFVLDVAGKVPGLPGLFIAGVFCASLSSLSSNLNSLAGTLYEDFVKSRLNPKCMKKSSFFLKLLVVIVGTIGTALVYGVEHLGGLLSLGISAPGIALGALLGVFTLGILFPRANSEGAFYGSLISIITNMILVFGAYYLKTQKVIQAVYKPVSVEGCLNNTTFGPVLMQSHISPEKHLPIILSVFKISFYWYSCIGTCICICTGLLISYLTKEQDPPVARELLSPAIYGFIDLEKYIDRMDLDYDKVSDDLDSEDKLLERRLSKWEENRQERLRKASYISDQIES
ncbi:sodium-coupled monocarboxylate transporter 2-like [Diorhabda carinulata]|uniref:sodium-coupled monocarboxylate transporter 2-like n=1 Tax=Diorhabda carinulata TaxID=1163345 RepID=UPI0025A2C6FA|nr:sodium-coupled monocarboxylate transporter 2-like [Diorhabda carinulata]